MPEKDMPALAAEAVLRAPADQEPPPGPAHAAVAMLAAAATLAACSADEGNPGGTNRPPAAFFDRSQARAAPRLLRPQSAGLRSKRVQQALAAGEPSAAALMDWAEDVYPELFPGRQPDSRARSSERAASGRLHKSNARKHDVSLGRNHYCCQTGEAA